MKSAREACDRLETCREAAKKTMEKEECWLRSRFGTRPITREIQ